MRYGSWAGMAWVLGTGTVTMGGGGYPFTEEAVNRGIRYVVSQTDGAGRGVAFADLDNDGDADLVVTGRADGVIGIYENDGNGVFSDRSVSSGLAPSAASSGVIAGDYDADGDLDLFFSNIETPDVLARNDGGFTFTDVAVAAGVADDGRATGCAWGDYDGDGLLDLYVANLTSGDVTNPNRLYRNNGNGTFTDTGLITGTFENGLTWQAVFLDFDVDGDADVYLSNDKGVGTSCTRHNYMFRNDNGTFVDVTSDSGTAACIDSMGVAVGDWDRSGYPDLYLTNIPLGNVLYLNNGNGTFGNNTGASGTGSYGWGWGAVLFDYDNDSLEDLYVCNEDLPNRLYDFDGTWPAVDKAAVLGVLSNGLSFVTATADIDGDGDLDLLVQNANENIKLYVNHHDQSPLHWVKFRLVGEAPNHFGIGASMDIRTGSVVQQRHVLAGTNFKSQNDLTVHVGLREAEEIDEITVRWPGQTRRTLGPLGADTTWTLYPPSRLGDANGDALVDEVDFQHLVGCVAEGPPATLVPGCEMMDFDGNGVIDTYDGGQFAERWTGPGNAPLLDGFIGGIPATSTWGNITMGLLTLTAGTLALRASNRASHVERRRTPRAA